MEKIIKDLIEHHLTSDGTNTIWWALRDEFDIDIDQTGGLVVPPGQTVSQFELWEALGGVLLDEPDAKLDLADLLSELGQMVHDKELEELAAEQQ